MRVHGWIAFAALAACSSGGGDGSGLHDLTMAPSPDLTMGMMVKVPDPGNGPLVTDGPDTEPNDTPDKAVPLGTGTMMDTMGVYAWMGFIQNAPSTIGGT